MHHLVGNAEEAEDLAQEVFLRVYRNRKKYRPKAKFSTWLFTIANNLALNALRNRQPQAGRAAGRQRVRPARARPAEQLVAATARRPAVQRLQQARAGRPSSGPPSTR